MPLAFFFLLSLCPWLASLELSCTCLCFFNEPLLSPSLSLPFVCVCCLSDPLLSSHLTLWIPATPSKRYYADFLYPPELSARLSDLTLEGEQSSSSDPQTPGTLV